MKAVLEMKEMIEIDLDAIGSDIIGMLDYNFGSIKMEDNKIDVDSVKQQLKEVCLRIEPNSHYYQSLIAYGVRPLGNREWVNQSNCDSICAYIADYINKNKKELESDYLKTFDI